MLENTGSYCEASTLLEDEQKACIIKAINMTVDKKLDFKVRFYKVELKGL